MQHERYPERNYPLSMTKRFLLPLVKPAKLAILLIRSSFGTIGTESPANETEIIAKCV